MLLLFSRTACTPRLASTSGRISAATSDASHTTGVPISHVSAPSIDSPLVSNVVTTRPTNAVVTVKIATAMTNAAPVTAMPSSNHAATSSPTALATS